MLPVEAILSDIRRALADRGAAVVHAPPGAGKTTLVPPALLEEPWLGTDRIVMLEPRRLAARAAAHRMAHLRGEATGRTIGYRTRLDTRVSAATRIEVVTEGVLTRMIHHDPTLQGYGLVIFDEFHERSLHADIGLALVLHTRQVVREDLRVLVMSATLDGIAVARVLGDAPVLTATGRQFDVETRYRPPPAVAGRASRHEAAFTASIIREAVQDNPGDVLVFLPGAPEIQRVLGTLEAEPLPSGVDLIPLHGSLDPGQQDRAIAPAPTGRRKVVLSTSIAETSLTIDGVRVVVDAGWSRRSRFSPRTGMSRLETLRVSHAAADQRRGRAGRTAPGVCYRLWSESDHGSLQAFAPPEILEGDLVPLALDLALLGIADPAQLRWLDPPPPAAFAQGRELLRELDAIDDVGRVTDHGEAMARLGMHPRLANMVLRAGSEGLTSLACELGAILTERDPLRSMATAVGSDLRARIDALHDPRAYPGADRATLHRITAQAREWLARVGAATSRAGDADIGPLLALAFPDRVAQRRPGPAPRYLLRNGTGAALPEGDALGSQAFLVIAESDGRAPEAKAYLAASIGAVDVERDFASQVVESTTVHWDDEHGIRAHTERRLGALVLSRRHERNPRDDDVVAAVGAAIRRNGLEVLHWSDTARQLRQRLAFLHAHDPSWPDVGDATLNVALLDRLRDQLARVRTAAALRRVDPESALMELLDWEQRRRLDRLAPTHFEAPTGSRLPIDYADPRSPAVSVRLQEVFGMAETPAIMDGRVVLTLHLLSPAHRPVQVTRDLAGFWRSSYADVRKDMRARYPRPPWPEDPMSATATRRAKPRKGG